MFRRSGLPAIWCLALTCLVTAQGAEPNELAGFQSRIDRYVDMHRRLEGPMPPLDAASDMDGVHRLMAELRVRIRGERQREGQGHLLTPAIAELLRVRIAGRLAPADVANAMADIDEHTPPGMPPLRVNEPLPDDAPFGLVPPQVLEALPRLPKELRWMVLSKALLIWDHHADLVVDIAPGLFDASTYTTAKFKR